MNRDDASDFRPRTGRIRDRGRAGDGIPVAMWSAFLIEHAVRALAAIGEKTRLLPSPLALMRCIRDPTCLTIGDAGQALGRPTSQSSWASGRDQRTVAGVGKGLFRMERGPRCSICW
jgi:hypothetical protein